MIARLFLTMTLAAMLTGCGHTQSARVGLMSFGQLEGKTLPEDVSGLPKVSGEACGHAHRLSGALLNAFDNTSYDTLLDAEVTTRTGLIVTSNCIAVKGSALDSRTLAVSGGQK